MIRINKEIILKQVNFTEKEWNDVADYRNMAEGHFFVHFDEELKKLTDEDYFVEFYVFMIEEHDMNPHTDLNKFLIEFLNLCYKESKETMDKTIKESQYMAIGLEAEEGDYLEHGMIKQRH